MNPFEFSRRWISFFGDFEKHRLEEIGLRVRASLQKDDKAVADGLFEAFEMLSARLTAFPSDAEQEEVLNAFEKTLGIPLDDAIEDVLEAMLFACDYQRGEEMCQRFARERLADELHMNEHRSEFLVRLGRIEAAESSLISVLGRDNKDAWLYVSLGDVFFTFQPVEALRDLDAADAWYYRGYDRGFANERDEAGKTLLRRLGQVCIERLRRRACARLSNALGLFGMGQNSYVQFLTTVRKDGPSSQLVAHLRATASADDEGRGIELLQAIDDALRFLPQDKLDGLSPFEEEAYLPIGKHEQRIANAMRATLGDNASSKDVVDYLEVKDEATGRKRRTVITGEREKAKKLYKDGKVVWKGFLRYREAVNIEQLFAGVSTRVARGKQEDGSGHGPSGGRRNGRATH